MTILQIHSSIRGEQSHSNRLAGLLSDRLRAHSPDASLIFRDLAQSPPSTTDAESLQALAAPAEHRSPRQRDRIAQDDLAISDVQQADRIVLGVPMYNFGIPVQLKAWLDAIARAGVTFRYTADGPQRLLTGKKVYPALTFGGVHRDTPCDHVTPYLKTFFGFLGMNDLTFIYAEGLAMGEDAADDALRQAESKIAALAI